MGYPIPGSVTHSLTYGFRNLLSIAMATEISFKQADEIKAILSDPEAMAKLQPAAPETGDKAEAEEVAAPAQEADKEDTNSDDSEGGLGGLFD